VWLARPLWVIAEFIQRFLSSIGDERKVIPDPNAKYFGAVLDKDGLPPLGQIHCWTDTLCRLGTLLMLKPSSEGESP